MNKSTKTIITAAAIAGLYLGGLATKSFAADAGSSAPATKDAKDSCKGKDGCSGKKDGKDKGGCASAHAEKKDEAKKK